MKNKNRRRTEFFKELKQLCKKHSVYIGVELEKPTLIEFEFINKNQERDFSCFLECANTLFPPDRELNDGFFKLSKDNDYYQTIKDGDS